jgi:purine-binding chemotaxis protein CheW
MNAKTVEEHLEQRRTRQYSTFRVHDLYFGIEVVKVQEVIRRQEMTAVPLASSAIEGLINLRGQIVIAIDTRRSLGLPGIEGEDQRANIVIRSDDTTVSLLVDEIGDVVDVPLDRYAPVPDNMPAERKELIECVYDMKEGLMLVLDTGRLLQNSCN